MTSYLRSSRRCAGAASSAADMSGKLDATASGDMTGSGNKPAKEVKNGTKIFGRGEKCAGKQPMAVLTMIALQLSWRISVKKREKRCNIGVDVADKT